MKNKIKIIIICCIIIIFIIIFILNSLNKKDNFYEFQFFNEIEKSFKIFNKVNINEIEKKFNRKIDYSRNKINSTINIGFTLDKNYILETIFTVASILATQKKTTKISFHFGVTKNFTAENMIKLYNLKNRINNLSEFNFYYLKDSVDKMKNFHPKGEACPGKFELPIYIPNEIERLIIFDAGDLIVLRDLTELYNYDMEHYWVLGTPEPIIIDSFMKVRYNITKYINIGSILLNIKKLKQNNFWQTYIKNRDLKTIGAPDQTLFNILIPDDKKNYLPFKFGGFTLFRNDINYDNKRYDYYGFKNWFNSSLSLSLPENPKSESGIIFNYYNPFFIHQFFGKWKNGDGISIYRHLTKYFIILTGISGEICKKKPGYCI